MKERRKSRRTKEGNRVEIKPVSEDKGHPGKNNGFSITDDISLYGIKVMTEPFFPVDSLLKIDLSLAKTKKIVTMTGKVRWIKSLGNNLNELGIEMVDTTKDNIKILFEHLITTKVSFIEDSSPSRRTLTRVLLK
ncbi:MAG: PilZ domain-containing protein [Candidatus Aminicenantaceae bacterium]